MTERLIIRNFAGLEEVDIELGRVNIFIGPQASGKSVCAKCLYLFKAFLPDLLESAISSDTKRDFDNSFVNEFKEYFPGVWRNDKTLFLRYEIADTFIQIISTNGKLRLTYSELFVEVAKTLRKESQGAYKSGYRSTSFLWESGLIVEANDILRDEVGPAMDATQSFILAGRSFFSALKGAMLTFLAQAPVVDPFLRKFLGLYELTRHYFLNNDITHNKELYALAQHVIKGKVEIKGDEEFIVSSDGRRVSLAHASSGQQEAFALLLILLKIGLEEQGHLTGDDQERHTVYIEEPEAHLFPESQRVTSQFMAAVLNIRPLSLQLVITTHSPYLLASFNNLIYAHQLAETLRDQPAKLKALYKVVPKNQQLALADVRVYGFENGKVKPLIDAET
ncbi:MAG: ATP-binding protein, partial [Bacteroidota bacterium]|nr:ATP-binding protein [Bacteroidota bacterium]